MPANRHPIHYVAPQLGLLPVIDPLCQAAFLISSTACSQAAFLANSMAYQCQATFLANISRRPRTPISHAHIARPYDISHAHIACAHMIYGGLPDHMPISRARIARPYRAPVSHAHISGAHMIYRGRTYRAPVSRARIWRAHMIYGGCPYPTPISRAPI